MRLNFFEYFFPYVAVPLHGRVPLPLFWQEMEVSTPFFYLLTETENLHTLPQIDCSVIYILAGRRNVSLQ